MNIPPQIRDACFAAFPFRLGLDPELVEPFPADTQQESFAFQLAAAGEEEAIPLIFRRYPNRFTRWRLFDETLAAREFAVVSALHDVNFPVLEPLTVTRRGTSTWSLMGRRPGHTPEGSEIPGLIVEWAELMANLHNFRGELLNHETTVPVRPTHDVVGTYRSWAERTDDQALIQAFNRLEPLVARIEESGEVLLHGNWVPTNILADQGRITAVMHWEQSALGDQRWDVATVQRWLANNGHEGQVTPFQQAYERAVGQTLSDVTTFRAITALSAWAFSGWLRAAQTRGDELDAHQPEAIIAQYDALAQETQKCIAAAEGA